MRQQARRGRTGIINMCACVGMVMHGLYLLLAPLCDLLPLDLLPPTFNLDDRYLPSRR